MRWDFKGEGDFFQLGHGVSGGLWNESAEKEDLN